MPLHRTRHLVVALAAVVVLGRLVAAAASTLGGAIPGPLPIFPADNWWNLDISTAPVDPASAGYITFIGPTRTMHPDFGGDVSPGSAQVYGFPYAVVDSTVTPRTVQFQYSDESDGVDHATNRSVPFYPIPDEAITQAHWIEGGDPGNVDLRSTQRSPPAHRRSRSPLSLRALQRVLRRQPVARRLRRVLRSERERTTSRRLDVGRCRGARDSAGARALRRGVRARRDRSRVSRDGTGHQRVRVPGVAPRGIDGRRAADGRATAAEGEPQPFRLFARRCRRSSARCSDTV